MRRETWRKEETALIRYRVRLADLSRHLFEVECRIDGPAASQRFQMPSWIPGSYLLREFARHVVSLEAEEGGKKLPLEQIDHQTWCCRGAEKQLAVKAKIFALDESVRAAFLDVRRAYFNGPCLFLLPLGREDEEVLLEIEPPRHAAAGDWRVATAMTPEETDRFGFGTYRAANYDELLDHPFEISDFESVEFEAAGVPHRLVVAGRFESDLERVAEDLRRLCETEIQFFGAPAPFDRYCFLGLAVGDGYGGLEHRASSSLIFSRDDLPKPGETGVPAEYQRFLALASHEYFHTWHVKRTKPAAFMPYRLDRRNHTRLLWVFEGMTSYYQEVLLLRSGLFSRQVFLQRLGELVTRVYRTPGRFVQTLADASFNAWDVLYKPEPNSPNASISYYTKGAVAALALDLTLRSGSSGKSLDDVMRALWTRYGAKNIGVPEDGLESLAVEIGGAGLEDFFDRMIRGTADPPLAELLAEFGISLERRPSTGPDDRGGTPRAGNGAPLWIGASHRAKDNGLELTAVFTDGPAERAGLEAGDVLVALDRLKVGDRTLKRRLARFEAGERVTATFFRGDELIEAGLVLQPAPLDTCYLQIDERAGRAAAERRKAWLGQ
ncbi:MAG TPA: PDZ domain-containing protein [Gammaproteobacteria bacterium]|nr:PDZ domain-containing protein [Gammaproteobacteria bacterium]